jgi:hypothetical protein
VRKLLLATLILFIIEDNIPISNAQQHATVESSSGTAVEQVATFGNTATTFSGSVGISGPRSYVDVTAYGAKGDGSADDSAAINAAITAACTSYASINGIIPVHADVFFPPGIYRWNRATSNRAEFSIPCSFIHLIGSGNSGSPQFGMGSRALLAPLSCPPGNSSPEFLIQQQAGVTFDNLFIDGCNEAMWIRSSSSIELNNVSLVDGITVTGQTDQTPLKVTNSFWVWINGGTDDGVSGSSSLPTMIFTNETSLTSEQPEDYLIYIQGMTMAGGGMQAIGRVAQTGGPETFVIRNVTLENTAGDFFQVTNQGAAIQVGYMLFDNDQIADNTGPGAVLGLKPRGGQYVVAGGIQIIHSAATYTIKTYDSKHTALGTFNVTSGGYESTNPVVDQNDDPIGNGLDEEQYGGRDHISNITNVNNIGNFPIALTTPFNNGKFAAPQDRWCLAGSLTCTIAMDPNWGLLFGDGSISGFSSGFQSNAPNTLDLQFANLLPPTSVTGTATTGGTLAAATYYAAMWATNGTILPQCANTPSALSTLTYTGPIVVSGSNNAINFTWTDPSAPLSGTIQGYCIDIETAASGAGNIIDGGSAARFIYIAGSGATAFAYTGQTQRTGYSVVPQSTMVYRHRLTPTSLGIGTLNPVFNADIRGSIAGATYNTQTNCSSSASPAACVSASAGSVTVATSVTTEVVNTTAITANSQVLLTFDSSLGTRLGVTCNTTAVQGAISARTAGASFTIKLPTAPSTNPACFSYEIVN